MAKILQNPRLQNRCLYCDKLFRTIADCLTHIKTKHEINRPKMDKNVSKPSIKSVGPVKCPNCHQMILSERLLAKHLGNCKPKMDKNVSKPSINTDIVEMLANCPDENGYITMQ